MTKRNEVVEAVSASLKTSHPALTLRQRTIIAARFADDWKYPDAVPGSDEIIGNMLRMASEKPELFREPPSEAEVVAYLTKGATDPKARLAIGHVAKNMDADARLGAIPYGTKVEVAPPTVRTVAAAASSDIEVGRAAHADYDNLSAQKKLAVVRQAKQSQPAAIDTAAAVKNAGRPLTPLERIRAAREAGQ